MHIEIYPLEKIKVDSIEIVFGMEHSAVDTVLGEGRLIAKRYYYFNNELAIDYRNDKVEFIEFLGGIGGMLKPVLYGVSVFETQANELVEVLKEKNNGIIVIPENGYSYQFMNLSTGLYREAIPDEVREMIEEASRCANPMSEDDIGFEMLRANHWATIGIGIAGYYQS